MLADKDIARRDRRRCAARIDRWHVAPLPGPRGASAERVRDALLAAGVAADAIRTFDDVRRRIAARAGRRVRLIELSFSDRS